MKTNPIKSRILYDNSNGRANNKDQHNYLVISANSTRFEFIVPTQLRTSFSHTIYSDSFQSVYAKLRDEFKIHIKICKR